MAIDKASKASLRTIAPSAAPSSAVKTVEAKVRQQRAAAELPGLDPEVVRKRLEAGRRALQGIEGRGAVAAKAPSYFRTYEQLKAAMFELAKKYPALITIKDIGDSFEKTSGKADRDLLVMRLTSPKGANKPGVFYFGGQHAREIANPELMMRFAVWLLEGYGKDPQATALLDSRQFDLMPLMNPDGHAVVERGYTGEPGGQLMKRKNTSGVNGQGTDLNRNWATDNWGTAGISHSPSSDTYCGPSPASEVETQAMQAFIAEAKHKMLIDWHSYSELVLYPPDDTSSGPTKDQVHYERVGKKFASFNGYTPQVSYELYPTSGTTTWAYDRHGVPAFCIETGTAFHQSDAQLEETWKKNFPVMIYAASIADDWTKSSLGPEIQSAKVDVNGKLTVRAFDRLSGKPAVAIEAYFDPSVAPGEGIKFEGQALALGVSMKASKQLVYVRAQDADGNWGPATATWLPARAVKASRARLL